MNSMVQGGLAAVTVGLIISTICSEQDGFFLLAVLVGSLYFISREQAA